MGRVRVDRRNVVSGMVGMMACLARWGHCGWPYPSSVTWSVCVRGSPWPSVFSILQGRRHVPPDVRE
jgi:hypothetical protein